MYAEAASNHVLHIDMAQPSESMINQDHTVLKPVVLRLVDSSTLRDNNGGSQSVVPKFRDIVLFKFSKF